ncbi:tol-pal system protein YbgF [Rhizobium sp. TH2]|uniref:tol-pal system protein YbgF n=1 Tax=Rhizobium sp. TH2 TaxID=2775403 RepID=UPI0021578477|nr:tol-pal system protein YbgF [Rhizobium sp. TH2]UVC07383.1 tol-pal system protein YbgF [Rhizobium sp. TH2]
MRKKLLAGMLAIAATAFFAIAPLSASAQGVDAELRVQQLEEQLRQLNGRVEEMSFQILQMQETLRKAQEDNEFRFQELEGGKTNKKSSLEKPANEDTAANTSGDQTPEVTRQDDTAALDQPMDSSGNTLDDTGTPPIDLGKLKVDEGGNVLGAEEADPNAVATQDLPPPDTSTVDTSTADQTASLDKDNSSDGDQYQSAYEQVLSGDYASAESGFADFIATHPDSKKIADANFWLGEAQYSQGKFNESAKTFLNAYKTYGKSEKAPEMLLKLAMSLAALDSKDTACATLREVAKAYPKASRSIITKVASEQKRLSCG